MKQDKEHGLRPVRADDETGRDRSRRPDWVLRSPFARLAGGQVTGEARSLVAHAWNIPWNILADSFLYIQ